MKVLIKKPVAIEQGQFGKAMEEALKKRHMTLSSFAESMGISYEHSRRLMKSLAYPSRALFEKVCRILELNPAHAKELLTADKLRYKYGDVQLKLAGRNPKTYDLETMIADLPPAQIELLKGIVRTMLDSNKRR